MNPGAAPPVCILCGLTPRNSFRLANGARLRRCPRCGLGWWNWPPFDPASFYGREYFQSTTTAHGYDDYAALEPGLRRTARGRLRRIGRILRARPAARPKLLDVGCGTGTLLDEARRTGWEVSGLEVSPYAVAQARQRGLAVSPGACEQMQFPPASFDCVTLWDVLEHVQDPPAALASAAHALRPGGVLALSTGDITSLCAGLSGPRWHLFTLPEHLFFFSPRALRGLLRGAGCRTVHIVRELYWAPLRYICERVRKSTGLRFPRKPPIGGDWLVPATLFDVLGVYAIRTRDPLDTRREPS